MYMYKYLFYSCRVLWWFLTPACVALQPVHLSASPSTQAKTGISRLPLVICFNLWFDLCALVRPHCSHIQHRARAVGVCAPSVCPSLPSVDESEDLVSMVTFFMHMHRSYMYMSSCNGISCEGDFCTSATLMAYTYFGCVPPCCQQICSQSTTETIVNMFNPELENCLTNKYCPSLSFSV